MIAIRPAVETMKAAKRTKFPERTRMPRVAETSATILLMLAIPYAAAQDEAPPPGEIDPAPATESPAPPPPPESPSFPGSISVEIRARYYRVHNLYDKNNKNNDNLNLGTERVRVRAEGSPIEGLTLRVGGFQVHSIGLGSSEVVDWPAIEDKQERPFEVDCAHVEWKPSFVPDLTLTAGRQDLVIGNGFLVGDGVRLVDLNNLIGYLENNRQDFDAIRADWRPEGWAITAFGSRVPDTEAGPSDRDLYLAGLDVEKELEGGHRPALSLVYARDERPRRELLGPVVGFPFTSPLTPYTLDDSNAWTLALSLRSRGPIVPPFGYSVEGVRQIGRSPSGANDNTLASDMVRLRAWGADARLVTFLHPEKKDLIRLRYVYLSGDKAGTGNNQFDPLLENQILGLLFNAQNNIHAWNAGASIMSLEDWQFHVDFWHFRFAEEYSQVLPFGLGRNEKLDGGDELDVAARYRWGDHWHAELAAASLWPGSTWKSDHYDPTGFNTADDWVWGVRMTVTFQF
jgi:hypothetical protein